MRKRKLAENYAFDCGNSDQVVTIRGKKIAVYASRTPFPFMERSGPSGYPAVLDVARSWFGIERIVAAGSRSQGRAFSKLLMVDSTNEWW